MIEHLRGTLIERQGNHLVLDVAGVGYGVLVTRGSAEGAGAIGGEASFWIRMYVREDTLRLYGFARRQEREAFDILLTVPGVGPAICLAILSEMAVAELLQVAITGDSKRLTAVKGVGKKVAEKILLEIKGKAKMDALAAGMTPEERRQGGGGAMPEGSAAMDAVAALEALDVPLAQARKAVAKAVEILGPDAPAESLVREGLRHRRTV